VWDDGRYNIEEKKGGRIRRTGVRSPGQNEDVRVIKPMLDKKST
jgi:hypothetical protein